MTESLDSQTNRRLPRLITFLTIGLVVVIWVGYSVFNYPIISVYHYVSSDGGFKDDEVPAKGRNLSSVEKYFQEYREGKGDPNLRLYRLNDPDWTNLLRYPDYFTNRRWKLPRKPT